MGDLPTVTPEIVEKAKVLGWSVRCLRDMHYDSNKWILIDPSGEYRLYASRTTEQGAWDNLVYYWDETDEQCYLDHEARQYALDNDIPWNDGGDAA